MHMNRSVLYALLFSSAIVYTTCGGSPLPTHKSSDTGSPLPDGSEESEASESVDSVPVASLRLKTVLGSSQLQPMQGITPLIYSYLKAGLNSYASTKLPGVNLAHPNSIHYEVLLDGETDLPPNEINNEEIDPLPSHFMEYGRGVYELHYPFRFMPGEKYKERSHAICADTCSGSLRLTLNSSEPLDRSQTHFEIYTVHKNQRQDTLFGIGPRFMFIRHLVFFNPNPNEPAAVGVTEIIYPWQSHQ
ncbi:hypothetical protein F5878DRAFT_628033 [Lentinula raphanica]|uniref:Lipoprotein n=1 Tax=Lentinula raphanica TaxID=153919 RepID=A0AA38P3B8_9AGAR|nr:hypothetical protein F5880DRAFT_1528834 [Lentinula raphanica]KAJ3835405.1 hypothetical protein F5878DRAFT_628033 [Lentinula raphanica]